MIGRRFSPFFGQPDAASLLLGIVIGLGVCAPLLVGGRVFLLDWSVGPHIAIANQGTLGLNGGLTAGVVGSVVFVVANDLLGSSATWLPIFIFFPIALVGTGRLAGRSPWSRLAAGTLYAVNPFVFNRIYAGHLPLLIGYALLPFAVAAACRSLSAPFSRWVIPALWWAVLTALSPHFAWIFGVVVMGVVAVALLTRSQAIGRVLGWFVTCVGAFVLMSGYIILPQSASNLPTTVGSVSLSLYRTSGDPHLGLFANALSLYGFWRTGPGPELPKDVVIGWPFLMFAILLIVVFGAWHAMRKPGVNTTTEAGLPASSEVRGGSLAPFEVPAHESSNRHPVSGLDQRFLAFLLLFVGIVGFFLALGNQGPTGGLFLWAYDHVPFFDLMREPQKFLMLLALAYAVFFGWGVEKFTQIDVSPKRAGAIAAAVLIGLVLPLSYTPTIFDGLAGQIASSPLPDSYQQANTLMGSGAGNILYLPWHLYMEYPFTNGRVVNNVAVTSFSRSVISGDDLQAGGVETQSTSSRSAYLQRLYDDGPHVSSFGELVAPLGVKYVVLAKAVDWASYNWLNHQKDLERVFDGSSLEVWRNEAYDGVGERETSLRTVPNFRTLLALAKSDDLGPAPVVIRSGATVSPRARITSHAVHKLSLVAYRIGPGAPGWVAVDAAFQRGWSLDGRLAIKSAEGTVLVRVGKDGGVLQFTPWGLTHLGYIESGGVFICLAVLALAPRRRRVLTDDIDEGT
jgi:hypothetical protein